MEHPIRTQRLILREWRDSDLEPFARLNADPRVMEFFPQLLTREESDQLAGRIRAAMSQRGFGLWAVEIPGVTPFAGFVGLQVPRFEAAFTPCVEVGWRLAHEFWGQGYAPEGGLAALAFGFEKLGLKEIHSMTTTRNERSRRVMEKLGLHYCPELDFEHPLIPVGNPTRPHVVYRITQTEFARLTR